MASTDFPFSVTSKYIDQGGAELLVTVRGPTAEQFQARLGEAATIFPRAGFATSNGAAPTAADPDAPVSIAQARRQTQVAEQVHGAHANVQAARANGHKCPDHGRAATSRYTGGLYCPTQLDDGSWCKWTSPAPVKAATN